MHTIPGLSGDITEGAAAAAAAAAARMRKYSNAATGRKRPAGRAALDGTGEDEMLDYGGASGGGVPSSGVLASLLQQGGNPAKRARKYSTASGMSIGSASNVRALNASPVHTMGLPAGMGGLFGGGAAALGGAPVTTSPWFGAINLSVPPSLAQLGLTGSALGAAGGAGGIAGSGPYARRPSLSQSPVDSEDEGDGDDDDDEPEFEVYNDGSGEDDGSEGGGEGDGSNDGSGAGGGGGMGSAAASGGRGRSEHADALSLLQAAAEKAAGKEEEEDAPGSAPGTAGRRRSARRG
jgi:hypothetical protein